MKKSLYRQVMFVISSICLILLITIAVKIGVFSELTSCVWIESILSVINNSYFSGVLCSIIAVIVIYFFQVQYSKRMLKKDVRCNEIIQDVYDGIEKYCNISNTIPERTSKNEEKDYSKRQIADKELLSQFTEWANEMSRQIRHRSYERSLTQSDKKFLADESVTDVDGVDISLGTELDSYDMDDSDSVANTDLLSKLSLLMDMGKKKTKYNVLNLNSKFTVDQKQTLEHVFDALYAKYTNAKANDIIQTIIDSF